MLAIRLSVFFSFRRWFLVRGSDRRSRPLGAKYRTISQETRAARHNGVKKAVSVLSKKAAGGRGRLHGLRARHQTQADEVMSGAPSPTRPVLGDISVIRPRNPCGAKVSPACPPVPFICSSSWCRKLGGIPVPSGAATNESETATGSRRATPAAVYLASSVAPPRQADRATTTRTTRPRATAVRAPTMAKTTTSWIRIDCLERSRKITG